MLALAFLPALATADDDNKPLTPEAEFVRIARAVQHPPFAPDQVDHAQDYTWIAAPTAAVPLQEAATASHVVAGTFYWFKEEGKGRFRPKPELIMAGDAPLRVTLPCQRRLKKDRRNHAGRQQ
jgi:hypothetical protein